MMSNQHCKQATNPRTNIPFERVLKDDAPKAVYYSRKDEPKSVVHWGQRKLLMSEIEFIQMCLTPLGQRVVVIYAGAAPGTHVAILSEMFPEHRFVLVDPAVFHPKLKVDGDRIITINALFSDELAQALKAEYAEWTVLFICDIRSSDHTRAVGDEDEARIKIDMEAQARWHRLIRPFMSMLKFRLPYSAGTTTYLDGQIYLPVWGPPCTTECRLIVDTDAGEKDYDNIDHERKMFFFNTTTRPALYDHGIRGCGIDHCYDCKAEIGILRNYLGGRKATNKDIAKYSESISKKISRTRTLASPNPDPEARIHGIRKSQWVNGMPAYEAAAAAHN
jgi:cap2 methyltransferase